MSKIKKTFAALLIVTLAASLGLNGYLIYPKLRAFLASGKAKVAPAAEADAAIGKESAEGEKSDEKQVEPFKVVKTVTDADKIKVYFTAEAADGDIREYVSVEPLESGEISISKDYEYGLWYGDYERREFLEIRGEFPFGKDVKLTIRRGLKSCDGLELAEDYVHTFRRKDLRPKVSFANSGRYLPPEGETEIAFESVNKKTVNVKISRVEPANIVQLLAREERVYSSYYGGGIDNSSTDELAGVPMDIEVPVENFARNKKIPGRVSVQMTDGGAHNGVYLVNLDNDEHRLVCVSDLGLSVRHFADGTCGVWVTSLTTGKPVAGAIVEVRSSANVKIAEGITDSNGWCVADRLADGEAFAVIAFTEDLEDSTFMALSKRMQVDETVKDGARDKFAEPSDIDAFVWTERGIYRHGEKVFFRAILRDGMMDAPKGVPVNVTLVSPTDAIVAEKNAVADARGQIVVEDLTIPDDQPSGTWRIDVRTPGKGVSGKLLASRQIKVEEFVPPQIRVTVTPDAETSCATNCVFTVSAEHLFGGVAANLKSSAIVLAEDFPFTPRGYKGFTFGNEDRGITPDVKRFYAQRLDLNGSTIFAGPYLVKPDGKPKAMIRATIQGSVVENGGRAVTAQERLYIHVYDYYIGTSLNGCLRLGSGEPKIKVVAVNRDGTARQEPSKLKAKIERIDTHYSYRETNGGWCSWHAERTKTTVKEGIEIEIPAGGEGELTLPLNAAGDYALTIEDVNGVATYARQFYLSSWADESVRASLAEPTAITLTPDKDSYRVGEQPKVVVKSPFTGAALLTVMREKEVYSEVHALTNATTELTLRAVEACDAPNLNVHLSVVQAVTKGEGHFAVRAHGETAIPVRPAELEIPLAIKSEVTTGTPTGAHVAVTVAADMPAEEKDATVTVTVVDEGINTLTNEPRVNPLERFMRLRDSDSPLYDIFERILPILEDGPGRGDVKTGGDSSVALLGKLSPVKSRRFKPLAKWSKDVTIENGVASVEFDLGEFAGEIRITAVAVGHRATGAKSECVKVTPKLVMQPDLPRFVAPGDTYRAVLPIYNRGNGESAEVVNYTVGPVQDSVVLAPGGMEIVYVTLTAPDEVGETSIEFTVDGIGEHHAETIALPVRPAVPWVSAAGVRKLSEDESVSGETGVWRNVGTNEKIIENVFDSPVAKYEAAIKWLDDYPHGCLEQTTSQVFPLIVGGGVLNGVMPHAPHYVKDGIRRIESMIHDDGFVMWPDCSYRAEPEVALYAAHFLFSAKQAGYKLGRFLAPDQINSGDNLDDCAYLQLVRVLGERADRSRMFSLYADRAKLSQLARSRLSLAFSHINDRERAKELVSAPYEPQSIKDAAFRLMALVALDPDDERVLPLVAWFDTKLDKRTNVWFSTEENAHALMALGTYYAARPPKPGEKFVAWRSLTLPDPKTVVSSAKGLKIARRYLTADKKEVKPEELALGDIALIELTVSSEMTREVSDLVIEELLPAAFEPAGKILGGDDADWVMRSESRDDRILVFSKKFTLEANRGATVCCPVRVVSAGDFALPGTRVEGMYDPDLHACLAPGRIVVRP